MKKSDLAKELGITISSPEWAEFKNNFGDADFHIELDGNEYRFILEGSIDDIYYEEQKEFIEEIYFDGKELAWWIVIDWDETIENVKNSDGYGNHFSSYDGSEEYVTFDDYAYYIFRTN
jgi:hypothetical protein